MTRRRVSVLNAGRSAESLKIVNLLDRVNASARPSQCLLPELAFSTLRLLSQADKQLTVHGVDVCCGIATDSA